MLKRSRNLVAAACMTLLGGLSQAALVARDGGMVYDTLFGIDEKGEAKPQMVGKYGYDAGNMTWTFELRDGLIADVLHGAAPGPLSEEIEVIDASYVNEAYERVIASDVRYRFVIDTATI